MVNKRYPNKKFYCKTPYIPKIRVEDSIAGLLHTLTRLTGIRVDLSDPNIECTKIIVDCTQLRKDSLLLKLMDPIDKSKTGYWSRRHLSGRDNTDALAILREHSFIRTVFLRPFKPTIWELHLGITK